MGPGYPSRRTVLCATLFSLSLHATYAQSSFNGRCSVTSTPIQARAEGLTERLGDINLQCTGGMPGSVLSGNLTFFLPVSVTNRVDMNNQTSDAVLSVDSGSGLMASAVPGLVSANSISFNGLNFPVPTGSLNLKVSGIRGALSQLGARSQQPVTASISATLPLNQAQAVVAYPQTALTATLYNAGIPCVGSPAPSTFTLTNLFA